jgi:adenosylhomocysteine nucleosidase
MAPYAAQLRGSKQRVMPDIAIVAALEREIWPLVKHWRAADREYGGSRFRFFEKEPWVAVCGGIGPAAARRATEAVISLYQPRVVQSVGFAGALQSRLQVGEVLEVRYVIDVADGSKIDTGRGSGVLVSFASVAGSEQKSRLAKAYGAKAVDMEAAAVAKGAEAHRLPFAAIKVISDEIGFPIPPVDRFTTKEGGFRTAGFVGFAVLRPWLWAAVIRLARNSAKASQALCERLARDTGSMVNAEVVNDSTAVGGDGVQ